MAKTYKKISGAWYPIKKIFERISGTWREIKKLYKKVSGTWMQVHSGALEYTFGTSITATSSTGILLSNYVNPASADEFVITINSGVSLIGKSGVTGATGATASCATMMANCRGSQYGNGGNGGTGGTGYPAIDFTGFSGKKVTFVNNGTIKGGNGGNGGKGGVSFTAPNYSLHLSCGGAGGAGGVWYYGNDGVTITWSSGTAYSGSTGSTGSAGANGFASCCSSCGCFVKGAKVSLSNGTFKSIEEIVVGDKVIGAFGEDNKVIYTQIINGVGQKLYDVNNMVTTQEHGIVNGNRDGFNYINLEKAKSNVGTWHESFDGYGNTVKLLLSGLDSNRVVLKEFNEESEVYTNKGREKAIVKPLDYEEELVYHLVLDGGSKTYCVDGVFVSGWCDTESFLSYGNK